ncbi:patatin-like phospholipase family protein [Streptomyces sp. NPDC057445]|uniref:patatin-like phospholipase family protein n=1 Tax=Streptomyces sp. NPDC057445 TaxID=3346136 RepID=UPI0036A89B1A
MLRRQSPRSRIRSGACSRSAHRPTAGPAHAPTGTASHWPSRAAGCGIIAGGMALALHELGLTNGFDAVYGASAGAASGAWLLRSSPQSLRFWADPRYARTAIRRSNPLRGRPLVDLHAFYEVLYRYGDQDFAPMDFASILAGDIEYHPPATDAATGESTDLRPFIGDAGELRLALRASAALPLLAVTP